MPSIIPPARVERTVVEPGIRRRVNRDGTASYEVDYRDSDGVQRRKTVEGGLADARNERAQLRADMSRGKRVAPRPTTVAQAADGWLAAITATDLKRSTIDAYQDAYTVHVAPRFGRRRLDAITVDDVAKWLAAAKTLRYRTDIHRARHPGSKRTPAKPYAPRTIQLALTALAQVYAHARRHGDYAGDPPTTLLLSRERPKVTRHQRVVLTPEETAKLISSTPPSYRDLVAFLAGTGARVGEVLALVWADVDLDGREVSIRHTLTDDGVRERPKSKASVRTIALPGSLTARLAALKLATANTANTAPVFQTITGTAACRHNVRTRGLGEACAAAGLPRITPHALRHGHGSALLEQGWPLPAVSRRLGHANPLITAQVYAHELHSLERTAQQRDQLDALYGAATTPGLRAV